MSARPGESANSSSWGSSVMLSRTLSIGRVFPTKHSLSFGFQALCRKKRMRVHHLKEIRRCKPSVLNEQVVKMRGTTPPNPQHKERIGHNRLLNFSIQTLFSPVPIRVLNAYERGQHCSRPESKVDRISIFTEYFQPLCKGTSGEAAWTEVLRKLIQ